MSRHDSCTICFPTSARQSDFRIEYVIEISVLANAGKHKGKESRAKDKYEIALL